MSYKLTTGWPVHVESGSFVNPETNEAYLAWVAEGNTPEPADVPPPPTKDQRIAEILATLGKGKDRTVIQLVILVAETVTIPAFAVQYGVTLEQAKAQAYVRNKTYRESVDCENACRAVETEP
jgi:hypothetical protein